MNIKLFLKCSLFVLFLSGNMYAQELTMFPGFGKMRYYQDDTEISRIQFKSLLETNDKEASMLWKKADQHTIISAIALGAELGFSFWAVKKAVNDETTTAPLIGLLGSMGVAVGFSASSAKLKRLAILKYNKNFDQDKDNTLRLTPIQNGLGLVLEF